MRSQRLAAAAFLITFVLFGALQAQPGNRVSGMVFGAGNRPIYDAIVELLDDYGRVLSNTRTDGSGKYSFNNVPRGKFGVRVRTIEPDYEEMTQTDETQNITRVINQAGDTAVGAPDMKVMDFYLKVRKEFAGVTGVVFAQDVPPAAKSLYEKAVKELQEKKQKEGLADLRGAIETFPTYFAALELLASEYERMKQFEAAASLYEAATKVNARSYRSWYGLALSLTALKYNDAAQDAVAKALEIFAGGRDVNLLAGFIAYSRKEYLVAEKHLKKAKELFEDKNPDVNWKLALVYDKQQRWADAAKELKAYLKNYPSAPDVEKVKTLITDFEGKALKKTE